MTPRRDELPGGTCVASSGRAGGGPGRDPSALLPSGPDAVRTLPVRGENDLLRHLVRRPNPVGSRTAFGPRWSGTRVQGTADSHLARPGRGRVAGLRYLGRTCPAEPGHEVVRLSGARLKLDAGLEREQPGLDFEPAPNPAARRRCRSPGGRDARSRAGCGRLRRRPRARRRSPEPRAACSAYARVSP